jgi:hypothetical protein
VGVKTRPIPITEGPAAGQAIVYFNAPWGLQLEAISYPKGMAYEKDASTILWTLKDPSKSYLFNHFYLVLFALGSGAVVQARSSRLVFLGSPPFHSEIPAL